MNKEREEYSIMNTSVDIFLTPLQKRIERNEDAAALCQYIIDLMNKVRSNSEAVIEYGETRYKIRLIIADPRYARDTIDLIRTQHTNSELFRLMAICQQYTSTLTGLLPMNEEETLCTDIYSLLASLVLVAYIRTMIADAMAITE